MTTPRPSPAPDDGRYRASVVAALLSAHAEESARAEWLARLRSSRWAAPAARAMGLVLGLTVLAAIGLWADPRPRTAEAAAPSAASSPVTPPAIAPAADASSAPPSAEPPTEAKPEPPAPPAGVLPDGRIVLNLATADELTKLPHIGAKRAKEIVALRDRLGRFRAVTDLLRVKGLGRKTLAKIAPKVVLDPPKDIAPTPPA